MKIYIIIALSILTVVTTTYALSIETNPYKIIEAENREKVISCMEDIQSFTWGAHELQWKLEKCTKMSLITITWTASGAIVPPPLWQENKDISLECEFWKISKVEWIEFHYTATDSDTTLQAIKNSHVSKWQEHIGYHYVIKPTGEVTNTRDESCVAWADKWSKNNYRFIQVAFVWDDKPTKEQSYSMAQLAHDLQIRYKLPISAVSAHADWGPKSKKESLEYWFWSKDEFLKMIRYNYVISIYWQWSVELQYMWRAWGDLDFIATIFAESRFNNNSIGDGTQSIWYCQIHKGYQPWWYAEYVALKSMEDRLNYCHEKYTYAKRLEGWVGSRFHGFLARENHVDNIKIE